MICCVLERALSAIAGQFEGGRSSGAKALLYFGGFFGPTKVVPLLQCPCVMDLFGEGEVVPFLEGFKVAR